jgi:hypothetical protein
MAKVSIVTLERAQWIEPPAGAAGAIESRAYFSKESDPIHLLCERMSPRAELGIGGEPNDRAVYVWTGTVRAGGVTLGAGSSAIVEFGASLTFSAADDGATLLIFNVRERRDEDREGGHVHLLPTESVSRSASFRGVAGIGGGLHADAQCPTCKVWLHEQAYAAADKETALHSHSEDEIIFVTDGAIVLGNRVYGPGTALAIAANVKYGFRSGQGGLQFINFRGASPTYTSAVDATVLDEAELWRSALGAPAYRSPVI